MAHVVIVAAAQEGQDCIQGNRERPRCAHRCEPRRDGARVARTRDL